MFQDLQSFPKPTTKFNDFSRKLNLQALNWSTFVVLKTFHDNGGPYVTIINDTVVAGYDY